MLLLLLGLCYLFFFHNVGVRYLWSPDEDEYMLVNLEMVEDGHWIYPTANGEPYSIKPPLFNWIGSLVSLAYGEVTEFTCRIPSSFAALFGIFLVYYLGKNLFGHRAGWLSAMVLAASPLYIEFARWIQINMISTVLLVATLLLFYVGYSDPHRRRWAYLLMYVPMGLGTLNMGPVNVVMPAVVIGVYLFVIKDFKHILQLRIGWGILIYLLIVAPWYVTVSLKEGYARNLLITTNLTRFFGEFEHARPFYYYFTTTPPYFLPWLFFLPVALYLCFSDKTREERSKLLFLFVWFAGLFVFFSLSRTKRSEYILPIFPALALLVGFMLDRALLYWRDSHFWRKSLFWPINGMLFLFGFCAVGFAVYWGFVARDWFGVTFPIVIVVVAGVVASGVLMRKRRIFGALLAGVAAFAVIVAYASGPVMAKANDYKSVKSFCLRIKDRIPENEKLKMYRFRRPSYAVYTRRFMEVTRDQAVLLKWFQNDKRVYVVTEEEEYEKFKDTFGAPIYVIDRQKYMHRTMLLLSNQADGGGQAQ